MKTSLMRRRLAAMIAVVSLAIVWPLAIAAAQGAEEGVANFYSDKFQGKKLANGEVYDKSNLAVIDVSRQAAEDLGFTKSGKAKVKLEVEK